MSLARHLYIGLGEMYTPCDLGPRQTTIKIPSPILSRAVCAIIISPAGSRIIAHAILDSCCIYHLQWGLSPLIFIKTTCTQSKVHAHRPIFRGFLAELVVESIPESADYTTDSVIVRRLPLSNMFNIFNPLGVSYHCYTRSDYCLQSE